jgi:hypothetical protein
MNIIVDKEFKALIPPLAVEERTQLESNIKADGCRDPLVLWDGVLIDGHNRYEICSRWDLDFSTISMDFATREDAKLWILRNQLGRRNLTDFQRTEIALKMKPLIEVKAREAQTRKPADFVRQNSVEQNIRTDSTVADLAGVSRDTVRKVEKIQEQAAPEVVQAARSGGLSIHLASQVADLPKEEQDVVSRAIAENATPKELKEVALDTVKRAHVANNSGNNEWYTPAEYIELARAVMGSIDTDPASCELANKTVNASTFYTAETNGLEQAWIGNVWLNPPYAQPLISEFSEAISSKYEDEEFDQACVLVNNATETAWFQRMLSCASAVCFPRGRVRFIDCDGKPSGAPLQGQAILYFGDNTQAFGLEFSKKGVVLLNG